MSANPHRLELVDEPADVRVEVTAQLIHQCPHVPETDVGTVTISWRCATMTVELHALAAYLTSWSEQEISHEAITRQIRTDLEELDGIEDVSVSTSWRTASMAVAVTD